MKKTLFFCIFFMATTAHAASFYCSSQGGNGYVDTGDSMDKVQATCGAPTSSYQQQSSNVMQQQIQTWIYSPRLLNNNNNTPYSNLNNQGQQLSVSFQVVNNQVTAISSAQQGPVQQWTCPNGSVSIGTNATQLASACGQPTTVNNNSRQVSVQPHNIVYWSYQVNQFSKPIIMEFQDGYLIQVGPQQ